MAKKTLIVNANILTPFSDKPISTNPQLLELKNHCILIEGNKIKKIGRYSEIKTEISSITLNKLNEITIIDLNNNYILPGFIDCHTHLLFDGKRIEDFIKRQQGKTYQEIAQEGGGIKYTVNQTLHSPNLQKLLKERIEKMYNNGTLTIEIKNGYAIDIEKEIEHLKIIRETSKYVKPLIIPTFLSHIPPKNFQEYKIDLKQNAQKIRSLTSFFDIFCDKTAFSVQQTIELIEILKDYRFTFRFHANEFENDGLIEELYIKYKNDINIKSFDHLLVLPDKTADIIKNFDAFAVIMPSTSWFLNKNYSPIHKLLEREIPICLATDFNAGSSNVLSLMFVSNLAAIYLKLPPENILCYITINPAFLLGLNLGQIRENFLAMFNILKTDNWKEFCFSLDQSLISPLIIE